MQPDEGQIISYDGKKMDYENLNKFFNKVEKEREKVNPSQESDSGLFHLYFFIFFFVVVFMCVYILDGLVKMNFCFVFFLYNEYEIKIFFFFI
jgi:hypothetical protein